MVPREGFEPPTLGLEVLCSIQLSYRGCLVRDTGVEPVSSVWKTDIRTAILIPQNNRGDYIMDYYISCSTVIRAPRLLSRSAKSSYPLFIV